jgi:pre-rRNA-processing protein RIX1
VETVFESLSALVPWYPTIFRPFTRQIRLLVRQYLAPTLCDRRFVCPSLSRDARHLAVLLYQTAAKNTGGDEWGKAVRELVAVIHLTTDQVFRAVIEDWESSSGYVSQAVDINQEIHSQENTEEDLPAWNGIDAGVERLVGLLGLLEEHFKHPTASVVNIPLGAILDLLIRLTSVVLPDNAKGSSDYEGMRLNPAIGRNEREGLWAGLEYIHIASMEVYSILVDRLQQNFASMAEGCLSQIIWLCSAQPHDESFRSVSYQLIFKVLPMCGPSLQKQSVSSMAPIIRACCKDLRTDDNTHRPPLQGERGKAPVNGSSANADTFLQSKVDVSAVAVKKSQNVLEAATQLLPLFISHLPQEHLQGYLRADIDRTAIFAQHKGAILASVLTPFTGKNGKCLPSILPHLCREFPDDPAVEALLRPRLPALRQTQPSPEDDEMVDEAPQEPEDMMEGMAVTDTVLVDEKENNSTTNQATTAYEKFSDDGHRDPGTHVKAPTNYWGPETAIAESGMDDAKPKITATAHESSSLPSNVAHRFEDAQIKPAIVVEEDDSDESVHLAMELSDLEDESLS